VAGGLARRAGSIEGVVWQFLPLSISPPWRANRKSALPAILDQAIIAETLHKIARISGIAPLGGAMVR
jgi:hypothetical protein